ncbi:Protein NETWORKED 2D like [Actinidia chinensis var. chinensis]|uniref:Protein NETWORKED 2D like n=1 Tax=Actinidia chinensis var. chinensis TaxID=1590841 RepID=A0A2R6R663_ACTCC|nr:Protein NETWORKED 2D like [Actinidia chinensis var. chinensis]
MLQRAASNAYSWWWASHVRTKQSKWLEQSLQDIEEKVQSTLKLLEEDGDSFAKRAEMYYKKRPELINFVEESYRAYRALAERYDHISKELQNANNTIASVFPEQVQFAMEDDDDFASPKILKNILQPHPTNNVPMVPKLPSRDLKSLLTSASKKLGAKKSSKETSTNKTPQKSGLRKSEALEEIDKLQKEILALQTAKEFVKNSYESGLNRFWEIENRITELQERVFSLQDEFHVGKIIEDDEARTLMAEAALKSCEEALTQLQEKQEKLTKEARAEFKRVEDAREKVKSLKKKYLPDQQGEENKPNNKDESVKARESPKDSNPEEKQEMELLRMKIKEHFMVGIKGSLTMTELAEKVDELASKVINLETSVSSQTALIDRLKTETDDLQAQIRTLEDDKTTLIDGKNTLTVRLREIEEKLSVLQDLNQNVENQNNNLQIHFTGAHCSLDQLSEKLHGVKPDEEVEYMETLEEEDREESSVEVNTPKELGKHEKKPSPGDGSVKAAKLVELMGDDNNEKILTVSVNDRGKKEEEKVRHLTSNTDAGSVSEKQEDPKSLDKVDKHSLNTEPPEETEEKYDEPNWQQMLLNGLEDREKILLTEYTSILRNYKDVKKKLGDVEQKNRDSLFEMTVQIRDLKSAIGKRDEEIQSLREKLSQNKDLKEVNGSISILLDDRNVKPEATEESMVNRAVEVPKEDEDVKLVLIGQHQSVLSPIEEKFRMHIDALLDENLDFWLRFSTSFHQIQKFKTGFQDLEAEISKLKEKDKSNQEGSTKAPDIKSDLRPIYKHLREIQTELTHWIEQSALLKEELQRRFTSLCSIQEEITEALKDGAEEEEMKFTSHEAAKFQGEVLNMKQENKKVRVELQVGLDHVTALQNDIEKTLEMLNDEFELSGSKKQSSGQSRVPLRSFIFGTKPKKKSIFSCMHHRKYNELRTAGLPM